MNLNAFIYDEHEKHRLGANRPKFLLIRFSAFFLETHWESLFSFESQKLYYWPLQFNMIYEAPDAPATESMMAVNMML